MIDQALHRKKTIDGVKWNLLSQVASLLLLFIVGVVLMRILTPAEFGLIGMVNVFSGFLFTLNNVGLGSSLIQMKEIDDLDKNTVFWFSLFLSTCIGLLLLIFSPLIARFYDEPQLTLIAAALSSVFIIQSLGTIHNVLLRKEMAFKKLFFISTAANVLASFIAILVASIGWGVWALVIQQIATAFFSTVFCWFSSSFRPKLEFTKTRLKTHLNFGLPLLGSHTFHYWISSGDNLLIGKFLGVQALGFYSRAYSLVTLPTRRLNIVFTSVLFPSFSQIKDDIHRIKSMYLRAARTIAFFILPAMGFLVVVAQPLVNVIAGENWSPMIPIFQLLAIVAAIKSLTFLNSNILLSQGRSDLDFKLNTFGGILIILGFFIGVQFGMLQVGYAYIITTVMVVLPSWQLSGKLIQCSMAESFNNLSPLLAIASGLTIAGIYLSKQMSFSNDYYALVLIFIGYAIGWILLTRLFYSRAFFEVIAIVKESISK